METCPLPAVADALGPFIHPREDVAAVRQRLQAHLISHLQQEDGQHVFPAALTASPALLSVTQETALSLAGVHKAYLDTLKAHNAALERHDALKADLKALCNASNLVSNARPQVGEVSASKHYIMLLRQRERRRKLQVIQRTFEDVEAAGRGIFTAQVDDVVKNTVGDQPMPPSLMGSLTHQSSSERDVKILELKKAVLSANKGLDASVARASQSAASVTNTNPSPEVELYALRQTHDLLVGWIESKLATIAEAEPDGHAEIDSDIPDTESIQNSMVERKEIETMYQHYLSARRKLIHTVKTSLLAGTSARSDNLHIPVESTERAAKDIDGHVPSIAVLPYLPALAASKEQEVSLLEQSTYIRRLLTQAEEETHRLIARLADESHLVQPGAESGAKWRGAAADAMEVTRNSVREKTQVGDTSAARAARILHSIREVPNALDSLFDEEASQD